MNTRKYIPFLVSLFLFFGCGDDVTQQNPTKPKPLAVDVIVVEKKPIPLWVKFTGRTRASNKQDIVSRVSGILEKRYIKDGEYVQKGQKLFKIQQDEYIASLQAAQAKLAEDTAALALAKANVNRYKPLVEEGLAPRATLEQYQAQEAKLLATIEGDKAQIKEAKLNLDYTIIKAPTSGKVSARRVDVGNLIDAKSSQILTTIVKIDPIYAYFSPSQNDVMMFNKLVKEKKPYAFVEQESPFGIKRFNGFVDFSDNVVDPLTSTITMRATIKNPKFELMPGSFVYVNIFLTDTIPFLMIPPYVILNDQLGKYLYIVDKNNKVKRVNIQTGYRTKYYASVKEGLHNGDRVIVSSLMKIKEGMEVIPQDVTAKEGVDAILQQHKLIPKKVY
jgi:RND family efflux transporter MFP subunit